MSTLTKLSPQQKSAITRAKNKAKNAEGKANAIANAKAQNKLKSKQLPKKLVKSKGHVKIEKRINDLKSIQGKRELTQQETGWKINAELKLVDRSLSQLYAYITKLMPKDMRTELLGDSKVPTFNEFKAKAPNKLLFSRFDSIRILGKFNKKAIAKARANKQSKATAKK